MDKSASRPFTPGRKTFMNRTDVLIIGCSPRNGGNTDFAAQEVAGTVANLGFSPELLFLRDFNILPCTGCRKCALSPGYGCVLDEKDQCRFLLNKIDQAEVVCFCSPIFFYHLPAHFKGLIDRGQCFYERWIKTGSQKKNGMALCVLLAGRKKGESLFKGSLLTLKYFLDPFNHKMSHLCLRGVDEKNDLEQDLEARSGIYDFISNEIRQSALKQSLLNNLNSLTGC
jgi:multimeric flavodoxin WrbA